ncbi:MAG: hypothetical protein A2849_02600 [Candidatus Taylorbacteria bacterium RIFCSPHIGHO2_01_FULL_51_15]|uniref:Lycopene cyclase domain-containing protein n=1 Tax=Candidatus Taylorbacteria bacterium RIFCSPHIGHO2_01_FULL_51_15 TaxID=1802304 RepID=A0A1G2MD50_9BACT|nr:MAG: hypothetical protein A2849_02600 [Candidatus Taylorbacteria bacterium RIFCSPHIGHO2_01_FULL_51_15]
MTFPVQYAYLALGLLYLIFWLILFLSRRDLRREMLISSLLAGFLAIILEPFFLKDYWTPELINGWSVGIEDFLYGFAIGGIANVLYEEFFKKRFIRKRSERYHWRFLLILYIVSFSVLLLGREFWGLNTMYATLGALGAAFLSIMLFRPDLARDAIWSGILFTMITALVYIPVILSFPDFITSFWHLKNLSGILLGGIPLEEFLWAFMFGLVAGPFYEAWAGLKLRKVRYSKL